MPWLALAASFAWLVLTGLLYRQAVQTNAEHSLELEHTRLSTMAQQLMDARNWNAAHGGVYVAQSDYGQPNPWLPKAEQTVTTRDGRTLVLVNPAYMSRQLAERSSHEGVTISVVSNARSGQKIWQTCGSARPWRVAPRKHQRSLPHHSIVTAEGCDCSACLLLSKAACDVTLAGRWVRCWAA